MRDQNHPVFYTRSLGRQETILSALGLRQLGYSKVQDSLWKGSAETSPKNSGNQAHSCMQGWRLT